MNRGIVTITFSVLKLSSRSSLLHKVDMALVGDQNPVEWAQIIWEWWRDR